MAINQRIRRLSIILIRQQQDKIVQQQMRLLRLNLNFSTPKTKPPKVQPTSQQFLAHKKNFYQQKNILKDEHRKILPTQTKPNILITAALPYVNNVPHLGNIIGALLSADVFARYKRLIGQNVLFIGGTDQYGTATEVKAKLQNKTPKQVCDQYHELHREIYDWFQISYNHFGRTSSPQHTQIVQQIFKQGYKNNLFVQKKVTQLFCHSCDMFLADRFVIGECSYCSSATKGDQCESCNKIFHSPQTQIKNIKCFLCKQQPQTKESKHLFINFQNNPKLKQKLSNWLFQQKTIDLWTNNAKGNTKSWMNDKLKDRCITRDLKWGVSVPHQQYKNKVFYVWFDAPLGYISITRQLLGQNYKKWWIKQDSQPQGQKQKVKLFQFMGKDNIIFHSITFPYCLLATGLNFNLPFKLNVTEYLQYQGGKFSKSNNLGVFGNQCKQTDIQSDVWRYYLLATRPQHFDSQFTWEQFVQKNNKQLSNSIGNLFNRILKNSFVEYKNQVPKLDISLLAKEEQQLIQNLNKSFLKYVQLLQKCMLKSGTQMLLEISFILNKYVQDTQFWKNKERQFVVYIKEIIHNLSNLTGALLFWVHFVAIFTNHKREDLLFAWGLGRIKELILQINERRLQSFFSQLYELFKRDQVAYSSFQNEQSVFYAIVQQQKVKQLKQKYGSKIVKYDNSQEEPSNVQKNLKKQNRKLKKQQRKKKNEQKLKKNQPSTLGENQKISQKQQNK